MTNPRADATLNAGYACDREPDPQIPVLIDHDEPLIEPYPWYVRVLGLIVCGAFSMAIWAALIAMVYVLFSVVREVL